MALVSAFAFICQSVLTEKDGVSSAIRIVELFSLVGEPQTGVPSPVIPLCLYINIRLSPDDSDFHSVDFSIIRPSGDQKTHTLFENRMMEAPNIAEADRTIAAVGQLGVEPKEFGRHEIAIIFDGKEVARTYFILTRQPLSPVVPGPGLSA